MKTHLLIIIPLFVFGGLSAQTKKDTLYNKTIISLTKMGLPPQTIISKINTSVTSFDVSVDALMKLQANGVNGDVINEMIKKDELAVAKVEKAENSNNPNIMHKQGIYYYNPKDTINPLKRIDPSVVSTSTSGGFETAIAQRFTYGLAKEKTTSALSGKQSLMQINDTTPVFYFYFKENENANADDWFFASATSPKEFVLVRLYKNKNEGREMITGSGNLYGSTDGIPEKDKVAFTYMEVSEGIFKVTFNPPLKKGGEYCFLYASTAPSKWSSGGNKVFDFGILKY